MVTPSLTPGQVFGHFRLIEEIGAGGMGIVYRAWDTRLERDVAVKVLNPKTLSDESSRKRFRQEALILSRLNHPNIESVYDFHSEQGVDYLVLEYVAGTSLSDRLKGGPLPEKEVLSLGIQLARGLAAAHVQRILHRDLKPANLRVKPDHVLKILDFGLAQLFASPEDKTLTADEAEALQQPYAGTPPYLSPEQLEGKEPDTRSDLYSAGVVLYEMATGTRPFLQRGQMLWDAIVHSLPRPPRMQNKDISLGLEAVILKCLEKDPKLRYQTANELLEDLKELARGSGPRRPVAVGAGSDRARFGRTVKGGAVVLTLAGVLVLGIAGGILAHKSPWRATGQQKIMAVLPMNTLGQDPATNALGLGLTETVTAKLVQASNSDDVQVVSPQDLRDKGVKTADGARQEFGTDFVLESSLQRAGPNIRINCYLVDSKTHRQVAAKTIQAEATDPFGLQDKVVSAALDMLPAQIKPEERRKLNVRQDTQPAAYEAYIRGRGYLQEYEKPENIDNAIAEFNQALKIDPNYAPAYAGLGEAYWIGYETFNRGKDWLGKASSNCQKALAAGPQFAEGYSCLGNVALGSGQYEEAVKQYQRALDLNHDSNQALEGLAAAYGKLGNAAAAEAAFKKAIGLRPNYWGVYSWLGEFFYNQARYAEAADMFRKVTELAPDNYRGYSNLGGIYLLQGRSEDAIVQLKRSIDLRPNATAYSNLGTAYFAMRRFGEAAGSFQQGAKLDDRDWITWGNLGDALYWTPGRRSQAAKPYQTAIALAQVKLEVNPRDANTWAIVAVYQAMLDNKEQAQKSLQRALEIAPGDPDVLFRAALVYNHFGERDRTLTWLKKAVDAGFSRSSIRDLPDFDSLKNDPEFQALTSGT